MKEDITKAITSLYQSKIMDELQAEVISELKENVSQQLKEELALLLHKVKPEKTDNVVSLMPIKSFKQSFESVELLAAAGLDTHEWFSTPINFPEFGFILDIRKVLGSEAEVDLTIIIDDSNPTKMEKSFSAYKNQVIKILIQNNDVNLLQGEFYIDSNAKAASGNGVLLNVNKQITIKNKLIINILE